MSKAASLRLPPEIYIAAYHQISWEEDYFLRGSGLVTPVEVFRDHLQYFQSVGKFISLSEALERLAAGPIDEPCFVITFDDGYSGILEHALDVLQDFGAPASVSLCPDFVQRREIFWRCKLYFLRNIGKLTQLKRRLKSIGYIDGDVKMWTAKNFSVDVLGVIDGAFSKYDSEAVRQEAWRLFLSVDDCRTLAKRHDVTFLNHSMRHWYYGNVDAAIAAEDFLRAQVELAADFGSAFLPHIVLPFGGPSSMKRETLGIIRERLPMAAIFACNNTTARAGPNYLDRVGRFATDARPVDELEEKLLKGAAETDSQLSLEMME